MTLDYDMEGNETTKTIMDANGNILSTMDRRQIEKPGKNLPNMELKFDIKDGEEQVTLNW
ncbi:hypothetical protein KKC88_04375 [Patescibacteria group bacterium]|nr:hypothetical protein [Patescibacteria group bacterium]MBU1673968.1 hypothetical protein [Patescibacteria group bacterium]MBU1962958.1 hypothetical protein [Patescibacteria group bacterium]